MALLVASVWAVPPLLDWSRFRHAIATFVAAELGRGIVINGDVALRLLPAPILTATDVDLPDPGDGTSAHLASLRLEVALLPLLRGQLAVRDLVLGNPIATLPWPLPPRMIRPQRPSVPHAFAAHVENGTLRTGQAEITGINAAIHGGPEASLAQDGPVTTFGAEGFAAFDGQRWRFTAALGAPDADNVSAVDLAVQGQGPAHDTGGAVVGTLSDGVLQARLQAAGTDLSMLIPASRLAWQAEAPFTASGDRIESRAITLRLGNAPATATFLLNLLPPARLDAALHAASLDLDGWSRLVRGHDVSGFAPPVPVKLAFDADGAQLLGGRIGAVGGVLSYDGLDWALDQVQASLPGGAQLAFSGKMARANGAALSLVGPVSLDAPDLRATLAWLRPVAPEVVQALPRGGLRRASLGFTARVTPDLAALSVNAGTLDGSSISGQAEFRVAPHPSVSAELHVGQLDLDDWLGTAKPHFGTSLAEAAAPFAGLTTRLAVSADTAIAADTRWSHLALIASTGLSGLHLESASAETAGVQVHISGTLAPDGTVTQARLTARAPDLKAARALLGARADWMASLPVPPGPFSLRGFADGPSDALTLQLHAETGDLTAEAESRRNTLTGTSSTTVTLRHPGASFLLDALGARQSDRWIGLGPLAVLAHVQSAPGKFHITDMSLSAADARISGQGDIALAPGGPVIDLDLVAPKLTLPSWSMAAVPRLDPLPLLSAWQGEVSFRAEHLEAGLTPIDGAFTALLTAGAGNTVLHLDGGGGGSEISLAAAVDASRTPAAAALVAEVKLVSPANLPPDFPICLSGGRMSLGIDVSASGATTPALLGDLSGEASLTVRNADIAGIDLPHLTYLLGSDTAAARGAVQLALTSGVSDNVSGSLQARFDHGNLSIGDNGFSSIDGSFRLTGTVNGADGAVAVTANVQPAMPSPAAMQVHYTGLPGLVKATADVAANAGAASRPEKPWKPRPAK